MIKKISQTYQNIIDKKNVFFYKILLNLFLKSF